MIVYPVNLLNLFIRSSGFLGRFLTIFYIQKHTSCIWRQFYFFLFNMIAFSSSFFFHLIALPVQCCTSSIISNKSGESLASNLRGNAFSLSMLSKILSCWIHSLLCLVLSQGDFVKCFSVLMIIWVLNLISMMYYINWFWELNQPCIPGINSTWWWHKNVYIYC